MTRLLTLTLVALLAAAGLAAPSGRDDGPSPDRGLYVFQAYCAACHGEGGKGDGPMSGKLYLDFAVRPADLSAPAFQKSRTDEQLEEAVRGGGKAVHKTPFMPAWGQTLTDRQVDDLVAFIRELGSDPLGDRPPIVNLGDKLELGRVLYTIHCLACHGTTGKGDGPFLQGLGASGTLTNQPPSLAVYEFFYDRSDKQLEGPVKSGITHSGLKTENTSWWHRALDDEEVRSLIFYLRSLPMSQADQEKT
ncbi:MAG: c-type cytochrome [Vulcanimicrobiota bacterium]